MNYGWTFDFIIKYEQWVIFLLYYWIWIMGELWGVSTQWSRIHHKRDKEEQQQVQDKLGFKLDIRQERRYVGQGIIRVLGGPSSNLAKCDWCLTKHKHKSMPI